MVWDESCCYPILLFFLCLLFSSVIKFSLIDEVKSVKMAMNVMTEFATQYNFGTLSKFAIAGASKRYTLRQEDPVYF